MISEELYNGFTQAISAVEKPKEIVKKDVVEDKMKQLCEAINDFNPKVKAYYVKRKGKYELHLEGMHCSSRTADFALGIAASLGIRFDPPFEQNNKTTANLDDGKPFDMERALQNCRHYKYR